VPDLLSDDELRALGDGGHVLRDGLLGAEVAALVRAEAEALAAGLRPARTGKDRRLDPATRGDDIGWLDAAAGPGIATLFERFEAIRSALNRGAYLGLRRFEVQLARYGGGAAVYARHRDAFAGANERVATAIYYLNPSWSTADGGALRLHLAEGPVDVAPLLDRLVLFLSERVEHEVLPVHHPRLAITAWYRRDLG
jgi:SM-20-related protein